MITENRLDIVTIKKYIKILIGDDEMLYKIDKQEPVIAENTFLAPGCMIIANVHIKTGSSIWYNSVLRGDLAEINIGENSNIQENCSLHVDHNAPLNIGDDVTVGHGVVLHGCTVKDNCLIGMGATILNNAIIGENSIIGAGALIPEGKEVPSGSLVLGVPGKVVRELSESEIAKLKLHAEEYTRLANFHQSIERID